MRALSFCLLAAPTCIDFDFEVMLRSGGDYGTFIGDSSLNYPKAIVAELGSSEICYFSFISVGSSIRCCELVVIIKLKPSSPTVCTWSSGLSGIEGGVSSIDRCLETTLAFWPLIIIDGPAAAVRLAKVFLSAFLATVAARFTV